MKSDLHEAEYYEKKSDLKVQCKLCPRFCLIEPGILGDCKSRKNIEGTLYALCYNRFTAIHSDPIEKKPLYHFQPSSSAMSFGAAGCNLHCDFCQNWQISQSSIENLPSNKVSPEQAVQLTLKNDCKSIAYTYNEPLINFEWIRDTCKKTQEEGITNVLVSNGLINTEPLNELIPWIDAVNIDVKAFNDKFYKELTHFPNLDQIKKNILHLHREGVHIELTMLLIPNYNTSVDEIRRFALWVLEKLDPMVPIHFSRFFPHYKIKHISPTPPSKIKQAKKIAEDVGLKYVYTGNLHWDEKNITRCHNCNAELINRESYRVEIKGLNLDGTCKSCGLPTTIRM